MSGSPPAPGSERMPDGDSPIVIHPQVHGRAAELAATADQMISEPGLAAPLEVPQGGQYAGVLQPPTGTAVPHVQERSQSLDALRGLFIVLMTVSFNVSWPFFPQWMYHRQFPPPDETFVQVAGITWPDIVFPGFLFAMAAAIPFALSRRIVKGETEFGLLFMTIRRVLLLYFFALLIAHSNTFFIGYTQAGRATGILGFVIMFFVFLRRREDWDERKFKFMNRIAWAAAIVFLLVGPRMYGKTLSLIRVDDIITSIAFAVFFASIIWYLTRNNISARMVALGLIVAMYLGSRGDGWMYETWWNSQVPDFMEPAQLKLLLVAIPGTIVGDLMLRSSDSLATGMASAWSKMRVTLLTIACVSIVPVIVIGLYNRWVNATAGIVVALLASGLALTFKPLSQPERLMQKIFLWSAYWLLLGILLEPFEGGISKVPDTLSYYFTTTGLAGMLLVALMAILDVFRWKTFSTPLVEMGQNAMLGYVIFTLFLNPLFEMVTPLQSVLTATPGEASLRILLTTILVIVLVRALTKRRIFWKT